MFGRRKVYYRLSAIERGRMEGLRAVIAAAKQFEVNDLKEMIEKHKIPGEAMYDSAKMEFIKAPKE